MIIFYIISSKARIPYIQYVLQNLKFYEAMIRIF